MAVKREMRHSAVFDGEERAATPNNIGGSTDEMPIVGAPIFSMPRRQNSVCSPFSCRVCAGNWADNGLIYGRKEIDFFSFCVGRQMGD
jgi:hypothetical protein